MTTCKPDRLVTLCTNNVCKKRLRYLPSVITSLRLFALPLIIYSLSMNITVFGAFFALFAIATDVADGYLARHLGFSSQFGANFDVAVDFVFIAGVFYYFLLQGLYPIWVFVCIIFMFTQFVITSKLSKVFYDPLGKYYGSFLYGAIVLTIFSLGTFANDLIALLLAGLTLASVTSRTLYLIKRLNRK
ncbi:MAG: CDP-alcohol phosphatidyltransferase family protein [Candidatus Bathyarchaeota archaeon]|nr:CDP-alcohol phosphatidyltransferase family protein [Candidatus Bathyarchaeota archaeon]